MAQKPIVSLRFVAKKTMIKKQEYLARWAEYNPRQKTCDLKKENGTSNLKTMNLSDLFYH
jgi:hypothetical protein